MDKKYKVAFSGPSGLGKTTLCKFVEEGLNIPHLSTSAGHILPGQVKEQLEIDYGYKGTGHRDVINLSSREPNFGYDFQRAILDARTDQINNSDEFVIDRCPIDNVAYLLSQVGHNMDEQGAQEFIARAQKAYFQLTHIIIIKYSQDIPQIEDNKSRVANRYFQQYISDVFMGVYNRYFAHIVGPRVIILDFWNLETRQSTVKSFLSHNSDPEFNFGGTSK